MEGYNPSAGCTSGCNSICTKRWVPAPSTLFPRRDPLIDAVGRIDDPCARPKRCPPLCNPEPKFRRPRELPECNIENYREEQEEAKAKEQWEKCMKCPDCPCAHPDSCYQVESLHPNYPVVCNPEPDVPPEYYFHKREQPYKSDIIAGFFNPSDNNPAAETLKERCDPFTKKCGPCLKQYPCRGVIRFPKQRWVSLAEEQKTCASPVCVGTKWVDPAYIQQRYEQEAQEECQKKLDANAMAQEQNNGAQCQKQNMNSYPQSRESMQMQSCPSGTCGMN